MAERKPSRLRLLLGPARRREEAARRDFALARQRAQAAEDALRRCAAAQARQDAWARAAASESGGGMDLGFYRQCAADLAEARHRHRAELARSQAELQARRQDLVLAMKQREGLEEALRRREEEAALEALRGAAKELDQDHAARLAWQSEHEGAAAAAQA